MTAVADERSTRFGVEPEAPAGVRRGVPWFTVLPVAIALAYVDGYWMTSLRGAVGAIARTQGPFATWIRESTLSLPLFILAVLAAVTLALRMFGPTPGTWKRTVATMLMIVGAGTLVGVGEIAVSSGYDFYLQAAQLARMDSIHPMCSTTGCLQVMQERSFWLQVHSVWYGAIILVITNLIVVGWIVAMKGGRLPLAKDRPIAADEVSKPVETRIDRLVLWVVAMLGGTAIIHAAVMPAYIAVWPVGGVAMSVLAAAELVVAACLLLMPRRIPLIAAVIVSAVPLSLWLVAQTVGIIVGPADSQPAVVSLAHAAAAVLMLGALLVSVVLLANGEWVNRPARASAHVRWMAVLAVMGVTAFGLVGSGLPGFSDYAPGDKPVTTTSSHQHSTQGSALRFDG